MLACSHVWKFSISLSEQRERVSPLENGSFLLISAVVTACRHVLHKVFPC